MHAGRQGLEPVAEPFVLYGEQLCVYERAAVAAYLHPQFYLVVVGAVEEYLIVHYGYHPARDGQPVYGALPPYLQPVAEGRLAGMAGGQQLFEKALCLYAHGLWVGV